MGVMKRPTLFQVAVYLFIITLAAKGIIYYGSQHPPKERLLSVDGMVREVRLGGQGNATWLMVESDGETLRYSSYYGRLWPGMERIGDGDRVQVLAERDRINRNELFTGRQYYIWELLHDGEVVVPYDDVRAQVETQEATLDRYVNGILGATALLLLFAYVRRRFAD